MKMATRGKMFEWALRAVSVDKYGAPQPSGMARKRTDEYGRQDMEIYEKAVKAMQYVAVKRLDVSTTRHIDETDVKGYPEPKADLIIDGVGVSVKLDGQIQLSSAIGATTAKQMHLVINALETRDIPSKRIRSLRKIANMVGKTPTKMLDSTKPVNVKKAATRRPKLFEELTRNGAVIPKYDYNQWVINSKSNTKAAIATMYQDVDFAKEFTKELLTGSRLYKDEPRKSATYILTPNEYTSIDNSYINKVVKIVKTDVRAKSRAGVSEVTFRFDMVC